MQDPAFKRVFRHPASIERLVRAYAPERAGIVDFGTLERLDAERVGEAMVRRYPDMMWIARVRGGSDRVLILVEFQGLPDPTMPLRMAVYELLTLQELVGRMPAVRDWRSVEVLSFVVHHGRGRWRAPRRLERLFERLRPGPVPRGVARIGCLARGGPCAGGVGPGARPFAGGHVGGGAGTGGRGRGERGGVRPVHGPVRGEYASFDRADHASAASGGEDDGAGED